MSVITKIQARKAKNTFFEKEYKLHHRFRPLIYIFFGRFCEKLANVDLLLQEGLEI